MVIYLVDVLSSFGDTQQVQGSYELQSHHVHFQL